VKLVLTILGLVAVFAIFGWHGMSMPSTDVIGSPSFDNWNEKLASAFDPSWYEKFQKADLATMLQAITGSGRK
jgi:hypothetical protein